MPEAAPSHQTVRFGVFELDLRAGELRKRGLKVRLQEKPQQVLALLLEKPGEVVTREELRQRLWGPDTFVDFDHSLGTAINKLREALGDSAEHPRYIETLPRRGYRFVVPIQMAPPISSAALPATLGNKDKVEADRDLRLPIDSIAVLPLENLSGETEQEYFADGMTDALITNLGMISSLRVISRTTAMHYKGTRKTLPEIASELNVDAAVEGTVLRSGNRVRVTANLLHAPTDRHLWANSYESELQDVLILQGEVARAIAEEIKIKVTPQERARLAVSHPVKSEAYEAYLKGNYALKRVGGAPVTGIRYFRQAIVEDSGYSHAYVGLCLAYIQMGFGHGPLPPRDALAETKRAALEALELDATLGEAHSSLAWVKAFGEWDWHSGKSGFRRGIELNPNSVQAHRLYAWYLSATERHEEAIAESQLARKLDPVSLAAGYTAAASYWWARQYDRFAAETEGLEQADPTYPGAHHLQGSACLRTGSYKEAIKQYQRAIDLSGEDLPVWFVAHLAYAYARAGKKSEALRILDELRSRSKRQYVTPYAVAYVHTGLGDKHNAFQCLEGAYAERNTMLAFLRVDPLFDPLRSDPRFEALLRRMNFPP